MKTEINAPLVLLLDDGAHVFHSVEEAESWLEVPDVRGHPEWRGYDATGKGLRFEIRSIEPRLLGIRSRPESVGIRVDATLSLSSDDHGHEQMREYLLRTDVETSATTLGRSSGSELLQRILGRHRV